MPNFELTAEGAMELIEQLSDAELDKLADLLLADDNEATERESNNEA